MRSRDSLDYIHHRTFSNAAGSPGEALAGEDDNGTTMAGDAAILEARFCYFFTFAVTVGYTTACSIRAAVAPHVWFCRVGLRLFGYLLTNWH